MEGKRFGVEVESGSSGPGKGQDLEIKTGTPQSIPAGTSCEVTAPMPGDIVQIHVQAGQAVKAGDPLCVLDAMKMKNTIHAPQDGRVAAVAVNDGQSVEYGVTLFKLG